MLKPPTTDDALRIREFFAGAGYTHKHLQETPALRELPLRSGSSHALLEHMVDSSPVNTLLRWFFAGAPQSPEAVRPFIPESILQILLECGLLSLGSGGLTPNAMVTPCDEYYFAADVSTRMTSAQSADIVLWPNPTTRLLQLFSIRKPSRSTLDLGTGCGILGILARKFSDQVTATDLNPRAGEFTRFNARLNAADPVEYLTGDTFEPVADRRFDLILANPPFFVTPTSEQIYCENEMDLDQYCRKVVRGAAQHLNEDGYFQAVLEWVQVKGETWQERLSEWLEGTGCDAWVIRSYTRDGPEYARERIRETMPHESYSEKLSAWTEYYRQRGVEEIHGGVLAMRRRSGHNWLRMEDTPVTASAPFGDLVLGTFATQDILHNQPADEALLAVRPLLPDNAQLDQTYRNSGGKWASSSLSIRLTGTAPADSNIEPEVAAFLARCDGKRTLQELADELSEKMKVPREAARKQCCAVVRKLAMRRILRLTQS